MTPKPDAEPTQAAETPARLSEDQKTLRKLDLNFRRNKQQDHTSLLDAAAKEFAYAACVNAYWNPEEFSLMWGTPLWKQSSAEQRVLLNQLYWVAYYSQIISAEIATISAWTASDAANSGAVNANISTFVN